MDRSDEVSFQPAFIINVPVQTWRQWQQKGVPFLWDNNGWPFYGNAYLLEPEDHFTEILETHGIDWQVGTNFYDGFSAYGSDEWYGSTFALYAREMNALGLPWCGNIEGPFFLLVATPEQLQELLARVRASDSDEAELDTYFDRLERVPYQ